MSNITIKYKDVSALERFGVNAMNMARVAAHNNAVRWVHDKAYISGLASKEDIASYEDLLSIDGSKSPHHPSSPDTVRNLTVLSTQDESLSVVFVDVKTRVTQENTIVETPLVNRTGSVKEFIQARDYVISITGNLISTLGFAFPFDGLQALNRVLKTPETFKIASKYLEAFDIYNVVVTKALFKQNEQKYMNVLPFQIDMKSDEYYELEIE